MAGLILFAPAMMTADEGMWLVNLIEKGLAVKMQEKGLQLDANVLYDENASSISDAVVSLAFGCSGSMISHDGLMITNHHCAYSDVHSLSTPEHNYLEDGFWAMNRSQELPVKGDGIYFLKKVIDVTHEVQILKDSIKPEGKVFGMRKVYSIIEGRYQQKYLGQGEVSCASMWSGNKYYMALYEVYKDVRLVAAPPVCIASYGAEVDNWEWPQHKGDFAIYRIYTAPDGSPASYSPQNVPLHPKRILKVSTEGVNTGDFTMVMGYPGRTNRYASSYNVSFIEKVANPIQATMEKEQMKVIDGWMNKDPKYRLKYADYYFGLTNVQEIREGEVYCYGRFKVADKKRVQEKELQQWIDADPERKAKWGTLLKDLKTKYEEISPIEAQIGYYRETMVRGMRMAKVLNTTDRFAKEAAKKSAGPFVLSDNKTFMSQLAGALSEIDLNVEKDLMDLALRQFYAHVDTSFWGDFLMDMYKKYDGDTYKVAENIWNSSIFRSEESLNKFISEKHTLAEYTEDPLIKVKWSTRMLDFNQTKKELEKGVSIDHLEKLYKDALYFMRLDKNIPQYPDANSTMRLTYGTVGPLYPNDGVIRLEKSTARGILEKYNPDEYIFNLKPELIELYQKADWGKWADKSTGNMTVNFITDNDITGGNSGSPVMNGKGELVGLAFDGNKESLAGDTYFDTGMNKCICVDIRYVMWILDKYAGMNYIIDEIFSE